MTLNKKTLELIMRLRQVREEKMASSSSSRRPQDKKSFTRRDREEAHNASTKIIC